MVKAPVGIVAMMYDTDILSNPYSHLMETIEKKGQYLKKRIERLRQLNLDAENGKDLGEVKDEARKKLPEVEQQMEYIKFLSKTIKEDNREYSKCVKERDSAVKKAVGDRQFSAIEDSIVFRELVVMLNRSYVKKSYLHYLASENHRDEDMISEEDWTRIEHLGNLLSTTQDSTESYKDWIEKLNAGARTMDRICNQDPSINVVDDYNGFEMYSLLMTVRESAFWSSESWSKLRYGNKKGKKEPSMNVSANSNAEGKKSTNGIVEPPASENPDPDAPVQTTVSELSTFLETTTITEDSVRSDVKFGFSRNTSPETVTLCQNTGNPNIVEITAGEENGAVLTRPPSDPEHKTQNSQQEHRQSRPHGVNNRRKPKLSKSDKTDGSKSNYHPRSGDASAMKKSPTKKNSGEVTTTGNIPVSRKNRDGNSARPKRPHLGENGKSVTSNDNSNKGDYSPNKEIRTGERRTFRNSHQDLQNETSNVKPRNNGDGFAKNGQYSASRKYDNGPSFERYGVRRPPPGESGFVFARR